MSKSQLFAYLDQNEEALMEFLKSLIRIKSENGGVDVPGPKEREIQEFLAGYLEKEGFQVDLFAGNEEGDRFNVVAVLPGKKQHSGNNIILNSHTDTVLVPEREKWSVDPFGGEEIDGKIYGRGANDMKGGLAASVFAAKAIKDSGIELDGDVILMLSCGEESCEGGTLGARACVKRGYTAPFAIVCEPTALELHNATCSLVCFELIINGKAIHISCRNQVMYPQSSFQPSGSHVGVDAVEKALPFLQHFYRLEKQWNHRWHRKSAVGTGGKPGHDKEGVGIFAINPSFIESGSYIGSVPGRVKLTYAVWYPPELKYEEILSEIKESVAHLAQTDDWLRENPPEVVGPVSQLWNGFVTDDTSEPVVTFKKAYLQAMGKEAVVTGFPMEHTCGKKEFRPLYVGRAN